MREIGVKADRNEPFFMAPLHFLEALLVSSLCELPPLERLCSDLEESKVYSRERLSGRSFTSTPRKPPEDIDDERSARGRLRYARNIVKWRRAHCSHASAALLGARRRWLAPWLRAPDLAAITTNGGSSHRLGRG